MNWYKRAKLINKNKEIEGRPLPLQCSYCKRWSTYPEDINGTKKDMDWKKQEELSPEEKADVERALGQRNVSHGICDYCYNILEENSYELDPKIIKEISLATV